jgi:hypothetical protein
MEKNKELLKSEFERIKNLGFVASNRPNNLDGGIGNTFEDYLGVLENNLRDADFNGFEIKSKRELNSSYVTLFSKSPNHPSGANAILKDKFGEVRDPDFPELKKLYASIFANRTSLVYGKYEMKLIVDRANQKLFLHIKDIVSEEIYDIVYWDFETLKSASTKMKSLFIVTAEQEKRDGVYHYHYKSATFYLDFSFVKFLEAIENGVIMFDIRIGVYKTGSKYGKPHDHGSGFRIKKENIVQLYLEETHI